MTPNSSGADAAMAAKAVVLCIPTFRRPHSLARLLDHVARLTYPGPLSVLVVENDAAGRDGAAVVDALRSYPRPLTSLIEPRAGQTHAYNTAFVAACRRKPDYVAVLDDDEYPQSDWLDRMVAAAERFGADIVGGPVFPAFDDPAHWLARSGLYEPTRYATGRVPQIYGAGSMLIRRDALAPYLDEPFSGEFAYTGGSDLDFFVRCRRDGRTFAWSDEAVVFETVPAARTTLRWLLLRYFRKGNEATRLDRRYLGGRGAAFRRWAKAVGLIMVGLGMLAPAACSGRVAVLKRMLDAARGVGRLAAEFNVLYEEYRVPDVGAAGGPRAESA